MGIACLASGGTAAIVGIVLILAGLGGLGKAKEEAQADAATPAIQVITPAKLPSDPADRLAACIAAYAHDCGGMFAVATSTGVIQVFPTYAAATVFADGYASPCAVARIPLPADVARIGIQSFTQSPLTTASCVGNRPTATDAERITWATKTAAYQTSQTPAEATATMEALEIGLRVWPGLYAHLPLEAVAAASEWLRLHAHNMPAVNGPQLAWTILARAEHMVATAALNKRIASIREQHPCRIRA